MHLNSLSHYDRTFQSERGSAVLIAVGIIGIIFTITLSLSVVILATFRSTASVGSSNMAYYAAEAAVEESLYMIAGHGPGMQYDSSTRKAANMLPGDPECAAIPFAGFLTGIAREWKIDSRTDAIPATQIAPGESVTLNLHRDDNCPYAAQPLDPADESKFVNLVTTDFGLDVYYKDADCLLDDPGCPTELIGDYLIALAGAIPVTAAERDVTITLDDNATENRIDDPIQIVSDFRIYIDNGNKLWEADPLGAQEESLYDNIGGGGWNLIVDAGESTATLDSPGTEPFAENVSSDSSELYDVTKTNLIANLYIDVDGSSTVTPALAGRWQATGRDENNGNQEKSIQYDIDKPLAVEEGALSTSALFPLESTGNRSPDKTTRILDLLSNSFHQGNITLFSYDVPLWYRVQSDNATIPEPTPNVVITISAQGTAGANIQILETEVEQLGNRPIFNRTIVY